MSFIDDQHKFDSTPTRACPRCGAELKPPADEARSLFDPPRTDSVASWCGRCGAMVPPQPGTWEASPSMSMADSMVAEAAATPPLSASRGFPTRIPVVLRASETAFRRLAALLGVAVGCAFAVGVSRVAVRGSMLHQMFDLENPSTSIPIAISSLFFWGVLLCLWRWRRLRALEKVSPRSLLFDAIRLMSVAGLAELRAQLADARCAVSPLLRRLHAVAQQWQMKPGLQDADLVLQQHVVHDEEAVHAAYALLRTFVWALPVLGLIGTVIGISLAVGGFAQFLSGNIEDVALIKQSLVGVTGGLSFAFLITLQGLLTSLLLMLGASALQTREQRLLAGIQQDVNDLFLVALQRTAPAPEGPAASASNEWRDSLTQLTRAVLERIREDNRRMGEAVSQQQSDYLQEVSTWTKALREGMKESSEQLSLAAGTLGAKMNEASGAFLERLSGVTTALQQQTDGFLTAIAEKSRATEELQGEIARLVSQQVQTVGNGSRDLTEIAAITRSVLDAQLTLQTSVHALRDAGLKETFDELGQALIAQSERLRTTTAAVSDLASITGEVLAAQATLQSATTQLREADFTGSLDAFRNALAEIGPVLAGFREPFVLQAVPAAARTPAGGQ